MIGVIFRAYCDGCADARAGRDRRADTPRGLREESYSLGYRDELRRMREHQRLAQYQLDLVPSGTVPEGP